MNTRKNKLVIASLATSMSASAALVPVLAIISKAYPSYESYIQLLITLPPLMMMLASFMVDPLLGRFPAKSLTIFGLVLVIGFGIAPYFFPSFVLLLLSRVIMGLGLGLITTISSSLPAAYFAPGDQRDWATGLQAAFASFGGILFSFLTGLLGSLNWKSLFLVQLLNVIPLIVVIVYMEGNKLENSWEDETLGLEISSGIFVKEAFFLTLLGFLYVVVSATFPLNLSIFIDKRGLGSSRLSGTIASINSLIGFLIGLVFPRLNKIFKERTLDLSFYLVGLSLLMLAVFQEQYSILLASSLFGIGTSLVYPAFLSSIYNQVREEKIVAAMAMYTVAVNIAQFVSPYIINKLTWIIFSSGEIEARFFLASLLIVILGLVLGLYKRNKTKKVLN